MDQKLSASPDTRDMISSRVVAVPNGRAYGKDGHVPCDYHIVAEYPDCTRTFRNDSDVKRGVWSVEAKK